MKIPLGRIILERRGLPKTMVTENGRTFLRDWEVYGNTEGGQVKLSWSLENKMETCPAASPSAKVWRIGTTNKIFFKALLIYDEVLFDADYFMNNQSLCYQEE